MQPAQKSICVFCGARAGILPAYTRDAQAMGRAVAQNGWRLVYGAGDVGLMGEVARAAMAAGAPCLGVIPAHLLAAEVAKRDLTQFLITENMHERKKVMFMNSDAIVVLPGGAGSLDEFFEVLTWAQLGLHRKPIFLLNTEDYWQPLLVLMDHIIAQGFASASMRDLFAVASTVQDLTAALSAAMA